MWIGKQVVLSLIEKEIFCMLDQKTQYKISTKQGLLAQVKAGDFQDVEDAEFLIFTL